MEIVRENMRSEKLRKSQMCRCCLAQNIPLSSIFVVQDQCIATPLPLQIMSCAGIEVYKDDGLPGMICANCRLFMNYCYQFKQMCNEANTLLKSFLTTGTWPKPLSLPKEIAALMPNLIEPQVLTTISGVQSGGVPTKIIKLSPSDLKNFKAGKSLTNLNRTQPQADQTIIDVGNEATNNDSTRVPLMTSTPIVKRQGSDLARTNESNKAPIVIQQTPKAKNEQKPVKEKPEPSVQSVPIILNKLVHSAVPKVEEKFVATGDGTVEMIVSYAPEEPTTTDNVFPCTECPRTYPLKQLLDIHQLSHKRERKYQCDQCDKRFFSKADLAKHNATHTGERPYVCVKCRASFSRSQLLIRHQMRHHGQPQNVCKQCDRAFLTEEELNKHVENHEKARPYQCRKCPKSFAYKQGLDRHEYIHSAKLPYQCEYCEQSYHTAGKLSRHLATHAGERPYPCRLCNKSFMYTHHLSRHLRRHNATGQSEYKCVDCGELFNSLGDLVYHSAKHAMESLICPLCRESFENVEMVTEHIKSHSNEQQYPCDYCDLMYTTEQQLGDHCVEHHSNELAYELPQAESDEVILGLDGNGEEPDNIVVDYATLKEEEINENDQFMDDDESTLVPLDSGASFEITEIEIHSENPPITSPKSSSSPPKPSSARTTTTVTKVQQPSSTIATSSPSPPKKAAAPVVAVQSSQEDTKPSRQQRMEEFFKRNQQAVEKKLANQKLSEVLKNLPKGVTVKMETVEKQTPPESVKTSSPTAAAAAAAATATLSSTNVTQPPKRGPGRPPKVKPPVETGKEEEMKGAQEKAVPKKEAPKGSGAAAPPPPPKRSIVPTKSETLLTGGKQELKRSASAVVISRERTKPSTGGQENSTTSVPTKPPNEPAQPKPSESQSWMIKRTYASKPPLTDRVVVGAKKRPADKTSEGHDAEEAAPSKRPALVGRKTLNPSMLRNTNKKESVVSSGKQNLPAVRASNVPLPLGKTSTPSTGTNSMVNVKNIPKPETVKGGTPMEMKVGGKTIKLTKITKEEALVRANQLKAKQPSL